VTAVATAHVCFGFVALALGTLNAFRAKGTPSHRLIGQGYYTAMLGLNGTAFGIYDFFGSFGVFHWLAVISLCTIVGGIVPVALRRPKMRWKYYHGYFMLYSYLGLLAATGAEIVVRVPPLWTTESPAEYLLTAALLITGLVTVVGWVLIRRAMIRSIELDALHARTARMAHPPALRDMAQS
jgi:uncharacterized membrane protein